MIVIGSFVVGYILGAKAGKGALEELSESWQVIQGSDEFQAVMSGATEFAGNFLKGGLGGRKDYGAMVSDVAGQVMEFIQDRGLRVVS